MPLDRSVVVAKINPGDVSEIPPDAPESKWAANCVVKCRATKEHGFPMAELHWKLDEDLNGGTVGTGVTVIDRITFLPDDYEKPNAVKMNRLRLRDVCDLTHTPMPIMRGEFSWDALAALVEALEGQKYVIYTKNGKRGDNGLPQTNVEYRAR